MTKLDLPNAGFYRLILADPPWRFEVRNRESGLDRSPDKHYKTMRTDEIAALPVQHLATADSLLAMWVYDPMLPDALKIANAWGFKFVTPIFRWLKGDGQGRLFDTGEKLGFGTGYHTRCGGAEDCWLFKRGRGLPVIHHGIRKEFYADVREHSRKPDEVSGWLVDLYGDVPRLEMFARQSRPGWDVWGDQVEKFGKRTT